MNGGIGNGGTRPCPSASPGPRAAAAPPPCSFRERTDEAGAVETSLQFSPGGPVRPPRFLLAEPLAPRRAPGPPTPVTSAMNGHTPVPTPEQVLRAYSPQVYDFAHRMLGSEPDAEEVTSQVLVEAVRGVGAFRDESSLSAWLYCATADAGLALRRRATPHAGRRGAALARELAEAVQAAAAGLPAMNREVFVLADVEGLS